MDLPRRGSDPCSHWSKLLAQEVSMSIRPVKRLIKSKPTLKGAGVHLRRAGRWEDATGPLSGRHHSPRWKTCFLTLGQNSLNVLAAISAANPSAACKKASSALALPEPCHRFEKKL